MSEFSTIQPSLIDTVIPELSKTWSINEEILYSDREGVRNYKIKVEYIRKANSYIRYGETMDYNDYVDCAEKRDQIHMRIIAVLLNTYI